MSGRPKGEKKNKYGTYSSEEAQKKKKQRDKSKEILDTLFTTVCALHPSARSHDPQKHHGRFNSALLDTIDLIKAYKESRPISKPAYQANPLSYTFSDSNLRESLLSSGIYGLINVCVDDWRVSQTSKAIASFCPFIHFSQYVGQNLTCLTSLDDREALEELKRQALAYLSPAATPLSLLSFPLRLLRLSKDERAGLLLACFCEQHMQVLHVGREAATGRSQVLLGFTPSARDLQPLTLEDSFWEDWDARAEQCLGVCRVTRVEPRSGLVDLRAWTASRGISGVKSAAGKVIASMAEAVGEWTQNSLRVSVNEMIKNNAVYHWYMRRAAGGIMRVQVCCHMSIAGIIRSDWVPAVTYDVGTAALQKAGKQIGHVGELHQFAAVLIGDSKRQDCARSKGILSFYSLRSQETGLYHSQMYLAHCFQVPDVDGTDSPAEPLSPNPSMPFSRAGSAASTMPGSPCPSSRTSSPAPLNEGSHATNPHILTHLSCAGLSPIKLYYTKTGSPDQSLINKHFWTAEGIKFPWVVADI